MWFDESSDPNRFMTIEERCKYVGAITESMLDEAVIDAESALRVYDPLYDVGDLSTLLDNLVKEHRLEEVRDRLTHFLNPVRTQGNEELSGILNLVQVLMSQFASDVGAIENKLDELKRNLEP